MKSLAEFEAQLASAISGMIPALEIGLDKVGSLALSLAAEYPGHYQPGWPKLAESTLRDKENQGFPVPSPLKRTGEMAESYRKELDLGALSVVIGSPEKKALWQEMGTSRGLPPRPVLALAMQNTLPFAADLFGAVAVKSLSGKP
jgi:hypothetical protein